MTHINLIFSARYVTASLQAEFGEIIPSLLPVGNKTLIQQQINYLKHGINLVTVPKDLTLEHYNILQTIDGVDLIVRSDPMQSLVDSIYEQVEKCFDEDFNTVAIILGDTIISEFNWHIDSVSTHFSDTNYNWLNLGERSKNIFSGYIYFSIETAKNIFAQLKINNSLSLENVISKLSLNSSGCWYDFGYYHNYHNSKKEFLGARYFNTFKANKYSVTKKSFNHKKIKSEVQWYNNMPPTIAYHCPRIYGFSEGQYEMEHLYANSLSELLIFGSLPERNWEFIKDSIIEILKNFYSLMPSKPASHTLTAFISEKTKKRLLDEQPLVIKLDEKISIGHDRNITLQKMLNFVQDCPIKIRGQYRTTHGDFCFSNILYDARSRKLSVIDPRGLDECENYSSNGFIEYDIAKLAHSMIFGYDYVIAGRIKTKVENNNLVSNYSSITRDKDDDFWKKIYETFYITETEIKVINLNLFLSMLPLHSDNPENQLSFIYIASLIYFDLVEV